MAAKRLSKTIVGNVVNVTEVESGEKREYDFKKLPQDIQEKFGPFGLSHRVGDSAAGKKGKDAVEAMDKVWSGLMEGNWTVRAPAGEKLTKKALTDRVDQMSPKDQKAAMELLKKLGVAI